MRTLIKTFTACGSLAALVASAQAQDIQVPIEFKLQPETDLSASDNDLDDLKITLTDAPKSVLVKLRFGYSDLSAMSADAIGELLKRIQTLTIEGLPVSGVTPLTRENLILGTPDGHEVRVIQRFENGRVLVAVFDENGQPVVARRLWFFSEDGDVIAPAFERVYSEESGVLQPTIGERYEIIVDRSQNLHGAVEETRKAALELVKLLGPSAMCSFTAFARTSMFFTPKGEVSAYGPCTVEKFDEAINSFELYETEQNTVHALTSSFDFMRRPFPTYELKSHTVVQAAFIITDGGGIGTDDTDLLREAKGLFPAMVYLLGNEDSRGYEGWADAIITKSSGVSPAQAMHDWAQLYVHAVMIDPSECCEVSP